MNRWAEHVALIKRACDVKAETADAIWYRDGDAGICEMRNGASFTCGDLNEFHELCEMFSGDPEKKYLTFPSKSVIIRAQKARGRQPERNGLTHESR